MAEEKFALPNADVTTIIELRRILPEIVHDRIPLIIVHMHKREAALTTAIADYVRRSYLG